MSYIYCNKPTEVTEALSKLTFFRSDTLDLLFFFSRPREFSTTNLQDKVPPCCHCTVEQDEHLPKTLQGSYEQLAPARQGTQREKPKPAESGQVGWVNVGG